MNDLSYATIVRALAIKLAESESLVEEQESIMGANLDDMRAMQDKIASLYVQLETQAAKMVQLRKENQALHLEKAKLAYDLIHGEQEPEEQLRLYAVAYMNAEGKALWEKGERFDTVLGIKAATGWLGKKATEWVTAYMQIMDGGQDAIPETKRSHPGTAAVQH